MKKYFLISVVDLIPRAHRRRGVFIICLLIFSSFIDLFSLASFLPLIILLINPETLSNNTALSAAFHMSSLSDPMQFALGLTLIALVFVIFKTWINNRVTYQKATYAYTIASDIAAKGLTGYLLAPFARFLHVDFTRETNRIATLPLTFANNFIIPAGTILAESIIVMSLLIAIAFYEVRLFIFLCSILMPMVWLYSRNKKRIKKISEEIKETHPRLLKYTLQAVEGHPEIKAFGKEDFFIDRFIREFRTMGKIFSADHTLHTGTSKITELLAAFCIGVLITYVILFGKSSNEAILLLSIYAGASFRIIPSFNRIFAAVMQMRTHEYIIGELHQITAFQNEVSIPVDKPMRFTKKIELQNISFAYPHHEFLFQDTTLNIHKGEKIAIAGRSGSGKTTLLLLMMRFIREQSGEIVVDGKKLTKNDTVAFQKLMGYVPQNPYVLDSSILENIAFGVPLEKINVEKVRELIVAMDLNSLVESLPKGLHTVIGEKGVRISGGQRQRLAIARALYHEAEILLLDEITNQLDQKTESEVMLTLQKLTQQNKTIILVSHRPESWKLFDSVYELRNGKFLKVTVKDLETSY